MVTAGFALLGSGNIDGAATIFQGLLVLEESDADSAAGLGTAREAQGRFEDARQWYETSLAIDFGNALARNGLARLADRKPDQG